MPNVVRRASRHRRMASGTSAFAAATLFLVAGCAPGPPRGVLLISIDTLRSDALETYGYHRATSPFLLEISRRAAVFENAFCPLPGTLPSHMSMLTGLYPEEHGVFPPDGVLGEEIPLAAEMFRAAGFRTFGSTEGGYVHGGYGFARGFEEWSHEARHKENDVEETLARMLRSLATLGPEERFFAFVHTYVVHDPYFPPEPYAGRFWPEPAVDTLPEPTGPNLVALNRAGRVFSPRELEFLRARYDAQIRYLDDQLGRFFSELDAFGLLDQSIVVLTSDHGEEFGEHGRLLHSQIYRECLQVPLLVWDPRLGNGRRIREIAETVDITPTLLELAGVEGVEDMSGRSLAPWVLDEAPASSRARTAYSIASNHHERSFIARVDGRLYQLLRFAPQVTDGHVYIGEAFRFDWFGSRLRLGVASLERPRTMAIDVDGARLALERIGSGNDGRFLELDLDPDRFKHAVRLAGAGCRDASGKAAEGCFLFQLVDQGFARYELYELAADPAGVIDLSASDRRLFSTLEAGLSEIEKVPRGTAGKIDDAELQARLRALGYLR